MNGGSGAVGLRTYGLASRSAKSPDPSTWTSHVGPISYLADKADYDVDWDTLDENKAGVTRDSRGGWLGFTDKYWLTGLIPAAALHRGQLPQERQRRLSGRLRRIAVRGGSGPGGRQREARCSPAPGENAPRPLRNEGITKLSKSIDWGWFEWFMRPIFNLLNWLFGVLGNFRPGDHRLTFIVRLILFPIADKQFRSMAGMRKVQPKMKALQERYKDDKPRLQQEMLKLYQEEKINPAAGCLPILLQIPIFYALYKVLMVSVEMRHQPFYLWIKDLPRTRPADSGQPVRPAAVHAARLPRDRRASDPARHHHVDPVQAQSAADGPWSSSRSSASCRGS